MIFLGFGIGVFLLLVSGEPFPSTTPFFPWIQTVLVSLSIESLSSEQTSQLPLILLKSLFLPSNYHADKYRFRGWCLALSSYNSAVLSLLHKARDQIVPASCLPKVDHPLGHVVVYHRSVNELESKINLHII